MPIKFGNVDISKIYFGNVEVKKMYLGTVEVYSAAPLIISDRCAIEGLGSASPTSVTFSKSATFPSVDNLWEEVTIGTDKFAKFTTWYRKSIFNGSELTGFIISNVKEDNDFVPYECFVDEDGNVLPYILIGRYPVSSTTTANSVDAAKVNMTIGDGRTLCRAKGAGYQQMDAAMFVFWRDLALAASENINFNNGSGVASYLGLARMTDGGWWIDGLTRRYSFYLYCAKPSKYVDEPDDYTDGYSALSYLRPGSNGCVSKLGYDSNHPTINFPSDAVLNSNYDSYYCDEYNGINNSRPCYANVGATSANAGLFRINSGDAWNTTFAARLCYKPPYVDAVFANNSWSTIKQVCESGDAANYWAVGDEKTDTGTDNVTRTFRIVDMDSTGIVLEQVGLENGQMWNSGANNNYYESDMRNTHLPATLLKYSNNLQAAITTTNVKVAENGNSSTILTLTDKLFLEAEKEVGFNNFSRTAEQNVLTTYSYYITHNQNDDRVKYKMTNNSASAWWLRSARSGDSSSACIVVSDGSSWYDGISSSISFAPCFRIGVAQTGGLGPWPPTPSADPVLNNNSWDTIKSVCEAGDAANYWAIGDEKTDVGTDGYTRTFRIVDMSGLYGKHVVFEQVNLEGTNGSGASGVVWDADYANDYATSDMNMTVLPDVIARYSSALQSALTNTTVKVAENGTSSTIVDVTNKLFLEAEKEVWTSRSYSVQDEFSALTTFSYYTTHTSDADHIKYNLGGSAGIWWLRSPSSGYTDYVCFVRSGGSANYGAASGTGRFAPCFSF